MRICTKRQALRDTGTALQWLALLALTLSALSAVYVLTYALNPAMHGHGPTPGLDLAVYRVAFIACPLFAFAFVCCALGAWVASLALRDIGGSTRY